MGQRSSLTEADDDNNISTITLVEGSFFERVKRALELTQGVEIARRYLAMNAFDGALTMLGLLLGGLLTMDPDHPQLVFTSILLASVGTSVAMMISGFSGSYLAESAEREREVDEIGKAMLADMSDSMYAKATRTTSFVVAIVDGLSPAIAALIIISPLFFVPMGLLDPFTSFYIAIVICMMLLFALGLFLGRVSGKSMLGYGAKTLFAGIVTALLMLLISILTGAEV
jgi:predicted membrane protein (TIGR00267 family)